MKKARGRVLNTFRLMAHHARSVAPLVARYGTLREGALDLKLRQLAYVKASQINGCSYSVTHNAALGQRDVVPQAKFAALADYTTNPLTSDRERLALRHAVKMTE